MTFSRFVFVLPLLGFACQGSGSKVPEARVWPDWSSRMDQFYGTPLGGPVRAPSFNTGLTQAWTFTVEVLPLQAPPQNGGTPLAERAAWVLDPSQSDPLRPTVREAESTGWLTSSDASQWRGSLNPSPPASKELQVALAPGQTFAWNGQPASDAPVALTAYVSRPKGTAQGLTLTVSYANRDGAQEFVEFDTPWRREQGPFAIIWTPRSPEYAGRDVALALYLEAWNPGAGDVELADALERGSSEANAQVLGLEAPAPHATQPSDPAPINGSEPLSRALARAQELHSPCSQDWLIACDEASVQRWLRAADNIPQEAADRSARLLRLEALCFLEALDLVQIDDSAAAHAFLVRQAGQLARVPEDLNDCLQASRSPEELRARLVSGNRAFLEHESPAARLRAFEWLKMFDLAPPGYDPLERSSQRQRALQNWKLKAPGGTAPQVQGRPH